MRLTHDEIETIRIHMNAFKENLCNQHRWKEAEEYQTIVDKLNDLLEVETIPLEIIEDDVIEYCKKRNLVVMSAEMFHYWKAGKEE